VHASHPTYRVVRTAKAWLPVLTDGTDLDRAAEPCSRDPGGELDGGRLALSLEYVDAARRCTQPTNRPVRGDGLAVLHPHAGGISWVAKWDVLLEAGSCGDLGVLLANLSGLRLRQRFVP